MRITVLLLAAGMGFAQDGARVVATRCVACHNEKNASSGLSLGTRVAALEGGNRGPAVVLGKPAESLVVQAIRHSGDLKMPPGGKLSDGEIASIERWIASGLEGLADPPARGAQRHWSFVPPSRPVAPVVRGSAWVKTEIDKFVLARMEQHGVSPAPEADARTLLRRLHLDLTGLPPTPEEARAFTIGDYEKTVDRLLASPHYGERWGRHWLDQARYADSDGGSRDEPRQIYKYRDWVIGAFNRDLPFDQFVREQIAGDLLPNATPEQITATGFQRNSLLQIEAGTDREQYRAEAVADRVDTFGTTFLGLSLGCAKCHDHKYDPIRQREYYQLFAFFNSIDEYGSAKPPFSATNDLNVTHSPILALGKPAEVAKWHALQAQLEALYQERADYQERAGGRADEGYKLRTATIELVKKQLPKVERTMVMRELASPRESYVLLGGDYSRRGVRVEPGLPASLNPLRTAAKGRLTRLDLAVWLTDPANPLLARVAVNRIWQRYFGRGIVETENDFGTQGARPSHPELLDWLASELVGRKWSQKAIHKTIVMSAVYRQSSQARAGVDPSLFAAQSRLRLDAEIIRDTALAASGLLTPTIGGPSVFPPQPDGAMAASQVKKTWTPSPGPDRYRRGMYTHFWRITPHPALVVFDQPNAMIACTRRARTTTPLQALTLLNDEAFYELARGLAKRIVNEPDAARRPDLAFELSVARPPDRFERERIVALLAAETDEYQTRSGEAEKLGGVSLAVWTQVARVLLNTDEFITRE